MNDLINIIKTVCYNGNLFLVINDGVAHPRILEDGKFVIDCLVTGIRIHQDDIRDIGAVTDCGIVFDTPEGAVEMNVGELKCWFNEGK